MVLRKRESRSPPFFIPGPPYDKYGGPVFFIPPRRSPPSAVFFSLFPAPSRLPPSPRPLPRIPVRASSSAGAPPPQSAAVFRGHTPFMNNDNSTVRDFAKTTSDIAGTNSDIVKIKSDVAGTTSDVVSPRSNTVSHICPSVCLLRVTSARPVVCNRLRPGCTDSRIAITREKGACCMCLFFRKVF